MRLNRVRLHPLLMPYIDSIWHFESENGIPTGDRRLIVPNARPKLTIAYRGSLLSSIRGQTQRHPESSITVIGMMESPAIIDGDGPLGTIGVEFKTAAAYRFFGLPLSHLTNAVYSLDSVLGKAGYDFQQRIAEAETIDAKLQHLEAFLLHRLVDMQLEHSLIDSAVQAIEASRGMLRIGDLCHTLGYSKRYLDLKFAEHIGISPKLLGRIVRFQNVFKRWGQNADLWHQDFYDAYYDQAHFIKEFKHFTGFAPLTYTRQQNEFGRIFYLRK